MSNIKKLFVLCLSLALMLCFTGCKKDKHVYLSDLNSQNQEAQNTQSTDSVSSGTLSEETQGEDIVDNNEFENPDITIDFETGSVTVNSQSSKKPVSSADSSKKPVSSKKPSSSSSAQSGGSSATQSTVSDEDKDSMDGWPVWD